MTVGFLLFDTSGASREGKNEHRNPRPCRSGRVCPQRIGRHPDHTAALPEPQPVVSDFQRDPSGFKHVPIVAGFERFGDALLDQQQGDPILAIERRDAVEDQIGHCRRQTHGRFISNSRGEEAIPRPIASVRRQRQDQPPPSFSRSSHASAGRVAPALT
jgi:hypothetical protein